MGRVDQPGGSQEDRTNGQRQSSRSNAAQKAWAVLGQRVAGSWACRQREEESVVDPPGRRRACACVRQQLMPGRDSAQPQDSELALPDKENDEACSLSSPV